MAVANARNVVSLKEKGHFEPDNARIDKYTLADELPAQLSELGLRPRTMSKQVYSIQRVKPEDKELVLDFLRKFFFRDEPMNLAVNLLETKDSRCLELEEYAVSSLEDGVSIAAVDDNGEYVGLIINGIVKKEDADYSDKSDSCPNPKFRRILKVLAHLNREARIWDKLPESCHTVLEIMIASTHSAWRGRGLMRVLCEESERIASSLGACALRMDTTSAFSAAAAERLKYKKVYGIPYADLPDGPQPEEPHTNASVYIKELMQ